MITKNTSCLMFCVLFFLCFSVNLNLSEGADSITANQSLSGVLNQTIVSAGRTFELGFFTPGNSANYYVGIWYTNVSQRTIVWVANREKPISDISSAELKILDGNLVLVEKSKDLIWSTNISSTTSNSVVATLNDYGNLVLRDESEPRTSEGFWQSFDHPADTWLPGAKISYDKRTSKKQLLISWRNSENPAPGLFSLELDPNGSQYIIRWNRTEQYWASGAWNGYIFSLVPEISLNYIYNFSYVDNINETYFTYSLFKPTFISRFVMDVSGQLKQTSWSESSEGWNLLLSQPRQQCEVYAYCGAFGTCNQNSWPFCKCLPGFKPKLENDWNLTDYSGGCVREIDLLQCGNGSTSSGRKDKFLQNPQVSLPVNPQNVTAGSAGECESVCLNNCSCTGYSYNGNTCLVWIGEIMNLQQLPENDGSGRTINVRLAASAPQLSSKKKNEWVPVGAIVGSVAVVTMLLAIVGVVIWRRRSHILGTAKAVKRSSVAYLEFGRDNKNDTGVPFCSWKSILAATENFSDVHKIGRGGFGLVYKQCEVYAYCGAFGTCNQNSLPFCNCLPGFKPKLENDWNLTDYSGGCVREIDLLQCGNGRTSSGRKDKFLRNPQVSLPENPQTVMAGSAGECESVCLNNCSCTGYSYDGNACLVWIGEIMNLQQLSENDGSGRTINVRLAASAPQLASKKKNEWVPVGAIVGSVAVVTMLLAIVGVVIWRRRRHILGTAKAVKRSSVAYLEFGRDNKNDTGVPFCSWKISGKRNTGFYQSTEALNLLGYAWRLWSENKALDLLDPMMLEFCEKSEVVNCINVGLLCVEEDPIDRPTMSNVVLMLSGEMTVLPVPKQPAFLMKKRVFRTSSSTSNKPDSISNELTMSVPQGR
ncbi:unnamed protein product [Fraxinus pennsylvanica]|uniref:Receptor-like serine/threonine-protein kinase n=1 Tax=Fraxinus pennsylvanica TaxID=56036 RepID=A0AAD2E2K8_9LAMI|nr:unnamed protein product [Fraxinus pennsylvanica]